MNSSFESEVRVQCGGSEFSMLVHGENELLSNIIRGKGRYSTADQQVFHQFLKPGGVFLDIGANIGWYSLVAGAIVGREGMVLAVEPEPRNLKLLQTNLQRNCASPFRIFPYALGEETSRADLHLSPDNFGDHSLFQTGSQTSRHKVGIDVRRLDNLISPEEFSQVQLLKIDTQGYEPRILSSLEGLLKQHRPPMMVEFSPSHIYQCGSSPFEIFAFLEKQRYLPLHINDDAPEGRPAVTPLSVDDLFQHAKTLRSANYGIDLLLLPMEHPLVSR